MTSHRSLPRRSSGSSGALLALAVLTTAEIALAASAEPLQETRAGVTIDWQAGTLTATGGAAADLAMPSVDLARPGATRRATAAAQAKLRAALAELPIGAGKLAPTEVERALGRTRTTEVQYQSNGGAVVRVEARFGDWQERPLPADPVAAVTVPAMRLEAAPAIRIGGKDVRVGSALYRLGAPPPAAHALAARVEGKGRLVVEGAPGPVDKLAHGSLLIYVQKVLP
jgi:hypothetical protein